MEAWQWVLCFLTLLGNDAHGLLFERQSGTLVESTLVLQVSKNVSAFCEEFAY